MNVLNELLRFSCVFLFPRSLLHVVAGIPAIPSSEFSLLSGELHSPSNLLFQLRCSVLFITRLEKLYMLYTLARVNPDVPHTLHHRSW